MLDRAVAVLDLLSSSASFICHIDENEYEHLKLMCDSLFPYDAGTVVWDKRNPMNKASGIARQHEYMVWMTTQKNRIFLDGEAAASILDAANKFIEESGGVNENSRSAFQNWIANNELLSGGEKAYSYIDDVGNVYQSISLRAPEPRTDPKFHEPLIHPLTKQPCPVPPNGFSRTPETLQLMIDKGEILFGKDHSTQPRQKSVLKPSKRRQITSVIPDAQKGKANLDPLDLDFPYCHPTSLYSLVVEAGIFCEDGVVLDYHAGSGTTGHAVINLNRDDGGQRKFILVEMGHHFDTVLVPRLKKIAFTPEWKDGAPKRPATVEEVERGPRVFKIVRLESYEDTLNNLEAKRTPQQQTLLDMPEAQGADRLREEYLLQYQLRVETQGSPSLLNIAAFRDPTAYRLKVKRPGSDETQEVCVDLLETFNWLIGLTVQHLAAPQTFTATFERDSEKRLRFKGRMKEDAGGPFWFRTVAGLLPDGRKTLVIWRKLTGVPEEDNLVLDEWFKKQGYSSKDSEYAVIYVNGGNNLENLKTPDDQWKVRLIEDDFHRLMFAATEGV